MKRFLSMLLALSLIFTLVLPAAAQEETEATVSEETAVSTEAPEETAVPAEVPEEATAPTEAAAEPSEAQVPETTEEALPEISHVVITGWSFLDPDEVLTEGTMTLYGVSAENPVDLATVISMLPRAILAEGQEVSITWQCPEFNPGTSGEFRFTAALQEGYVLSAEASKVSCLVVVIPAAAEEDQPQKEEDSADTEVNLANGDIALDESHFPDVNFRLALMNQVDINSDGILSLAERSAIDMLDLTYKHIDGLNGISVFPNLQYLYCDGNNLTSLDLRELPSLLELYCSDNPLTSVNVKGLKNLHTLIALSAPIASLQLDGCRNLQKMFLSACALKTFTLRNHPALNNLAISSSESLTALDLTGCRALQDLSADNCSLTSLNLESCTALKRLFCGNNQLEDLDLHTNQNLSLMDCSGNRLPYLDLSVCPNLSDQNAFSFQNVLLVNKKDVPLAELSPSLRAKDLKVLAGGTISRKNLHMTDDVLTYEYNCGTAANYIPMEVILIYDEPGGIKFPIDETNFPDPVLRQYVKDHIDQNGDGFMTRAERSAVLSLSLERKTITSMKGLEHFKNISLLSLQNSSISTLDLPELPNLFELNINGTQISSLDFTNTPNVGSLSINSTPITSLDLSKLSDLTSLFMTGASVQSLDLSAAPSLYTLSCSYSDLTSLDLSKNTELRHLECRGLKLQALNLTHNPKLNYLDCGENQLKTLDLSQNAQLGSVDIGYNQLTSIDLSHAPNLYNFICESNTLYYSTSDETLDLNTLPGFDLRKASDWQNGTVDGNGILTADLMGQEISYRYNTGSPSFSSAVFGIVLVDKEIPIDKTNFPDPAFRYYVQNVIDMDRSGTLSRGERMNTTSIQIISQTDLGGQKVVSLKGIEYFPALQRLNCDSQALKELTLSGFEYLKEVAVSRNPLKTLNVSDVPKLQLLYCLNTDITSLDLQNNPDLRLLNCSNTPLTRLTFGNNSKLWSLTIDDTALTAIDTGSLPALKEFSCTQSKITGLDLSKNTRLENLNCSVTAITYLDLSHCPNLTDLNANTARLSSLDLTGNPKLSFVDLNANTRAFQTDAGKVSLRELKGFDPGRASNWQGGRIVAGYLVPDPGSQTISYDYSVTPTRKQSFEVKIHSASKKFTIAAANMTLGNDLTMHFYVNRKDLDSYESYYAQITRSFADGRPDEVRKINQYEWSNFSQDMVRFSFTGLAAKEMADSLKVQIFFADHTPASEIKLDSIRDYCMRNIPKYSSMLKTLMVDMLNYGAAAQQQFGYGTSDLANARLTAQQQSYATKTVSMQDHRSKGAHYAGSTLKLESRLMMDLYFTGLTKDMSAVVTYTDHTGAAHSRTVPYASMKPNGAYRVVTVDDMVVSDCRQLIRCQILDGNGKPVSETTDNPESYCARMQQKGAIYEAIMKFSTSAHYYLHNR